MKYIVTAFFLLFSFGLFAQDQTQSRKTYLLSIDSRDSLIKVDVLYKKLNGYIKPNLVYYWTTSNQILRTQGGFDGRVLHGSYTSFFVNKNLKEKGYFRKGLKRGKWVTWYDNGNIKEISRYHHGTKCGRFESFDGSGNLISKGKYRNDKLQGRLKFFQNGKISKRLKYTNGIEIPAKQKKEAKQRLKRESTAKEIIIPEAQNSKQREEWKLKTRNLRTKVKMWFKKKNADQKQDSKTLQSPKENTKESPGKNKKDNKKG